MPQYDPAAAHERRMARAAARRRAQQRRRKRRLRLLILCLLALVLLVAAPHLWHRAEQLLYPRKYEQLVDQWAQTYKLDPLLVDAFIRTESGFDPVATSSVDARGLMQMTEETFIWLRSKIAADEDLSFAVPVSYTHLRLPTIWILKTCKTRTRASASGATTCICVWNATTVMWPPLQPPTTAAGALWTICCGWKSTRPTARRCRASPTVR